MADDSYANKCRWREFLPRKVLRSNKAEENGHIGNSLEVVRTKMLLRMKTAANRSFLTDKPWKVTVQATIGSASMNSPWEGGGGGGGGAPSLAQVELHPILCPNATTATYTPQVCPQTQHKQAVGSGFGGVNCLPSLKIVRLYSPPLPPHTQNI